MVVWASVAWQPIVRASRPREVVAYEALARFGDGRSPREWFDAAERAGRADEIEAMLLDAALRDRPPRAGLVAVNCTPRLMRPGSRVAEVLAEADLAAVVVDLSEQGAAAGELAPLLADLRRRGALLALDDSGAGYTGLANLAVLRPDWVKLDPRVVEACDADDVARASVGMYVRVARRVGAVTVAEGVERKAQLDVLVDLGVDLAQGWLFGAPQAGAPSVRLPEELTAALGGVPA